MDNITIDVSEPCVKWIKKIITETSIKFSDYDKINDFKHVANIMIDNEINIKKNKKARNTVIKFVPVISKEEYKDKNTEWIYIFTINEIIVKIGGTRTGLKERIGSYLCGHYTTDRGNSGKCSVTNAFIYNTFDFYLRKGFKIKMYGHELEKKYTLINELGFNDIKVRVQYYHALESMLLNDFKKKNNYYPQLSDNTDPNYKD